MNSFFFPFWEKIVNGFCPKNREIEGACLRNETFSFQFGFVNETEELFSSDPILEVESPIKEHLRVRLVEPVACSLPFRSRHDEGYLVYQPALVGDLLRDIDHLILRFGTYQSVLFTYDGKGDPGIYPVIARIKTGDGRLLGEATYSLKVLKSSLPPLSLHYTNWMHYDGIAEYYGVEVFSPRYYEILSSFLLSAVDHGMDTLLVPLFTPPLDTAVGGERMTTQLVEVKKKGDVYSFCFDRLLYFLSFVEERGIQRFEMSHLFTQWGAEHAPKIVDTTGTRLFGWETDSLNPEYLGFLSSFLKELTTFLREHGFGPDRVYFHLSDEPNALHIEHYEKLKTSITSFLNGYPTMDALSDYAFAAKGLVDLPAVALEQVPKFMEEGRNDIYVYHCCSEDHDFLPNRFLSMPLERLRVLGVQLYYLGVKGLLHWGFNFYNSGFSKRPINPYEVNDAEGNFPSGDSFIVYPGKDGKVEETLRLETLSAAFADYRALTLLENKYGRERVIAFLSKEGFHSNFTDYPRSEGYLSDLRNRINLAIENNEFPKQ